MRTTTTWTGQITAVSSVIHGGERGGTISLLRREKMRLPDGRMVHVPIVSGNSFRGALRRVAAGLFTDALELEGALPPAAAQVLIGGGGALHKSSKAPLSGERLKRLFELVPPLAAFGGTTTRTLGGAVMVGPMLYRFEAFPVGTMFSSWVRLERATPLLTAFMDEVIATWSASGRLGGRRGTGHGCVAASWGRTGVPAPAPECDWRSKLVPQRAEVVAALHELR